MKGCLTDQDQDERGDDGQEGNQVDDHVELEPGLDGMLEVAREDGHGSYQQRPCDDHD